MGTGDPPKRHRRGNISNPDRIFDPGFCFIDQENAVCNRLNLREGVWVETMFSFSDAAVPDE